MSDPLKADAGESAAAKRSDAAGGVVADRIIAAAAAVLAVAVFVGTYRFSKVPPTLMGGLGAVEFPRLIAVVLLVLSVLLAFRPARRALPGLPPLAWQLMGAVVGFAVLVHLVGMLLSMLAFMIVVGWLWGERRIAVLLASAIAITAVIWGLFELLFKISLPGGLLGALFR